MNLLLIFKCGFVMNLILVLFFICVPMKINFFILYLQQVTIIEIFQLLYSMKGCLLLIPI